MSSTAFQRKLDFAPTASIDKVALNNKVVFMRPIVRRAKIHTINALVKKIQKLKNKKGTESQQQVNQNKSARLVEEMKIIKMLKPDYVAKYAFGSTEQFETLAAKPTTTTDVRAIARLAQNKFIQDEVVKFRKEHADWQELAAFLMTKHTSREFKTKKNKEKMKKVEANMKASEHLVQKFLGEKLKGTVEDESPDESDGGDNSDGENDRLNVAQENDSDYESNSSKLNERNSVTDNRGKLDRKIVKENQGNVDQKKSENQNSLKEKRKRLLMAASPEDGSEEKEGLDVYSGNRGNDDGDSEQNSEDAREERYGLDVSKGNRGTDDGDSDDDSDSQDERSEDEDKNSSEEDTGDNGSDSEDEMDENDEEEEESFGDLSEDSTAEIDQETARTGNKVRKEKMKSISDKDKKGKEKNTVKETGEKKKKISEKVEGEIIVRKIDLSRNDDEYDVPKIMQQRGERSIKSKKRKMDAFFDCGEDGDDTQANDTNDNDSKDTKDSKIEDTDGNQANNSYVSNFIQPTRASFSTCFVGSLRANTMMGCNDARYRSNEDWKRMRHEAKEQNMSRDGEAVGSFSRGRGFGAPPFRGRGFSHQAPSGRGRGRGHRLDTGENQKASKPVEKGLHPSWEASKKRKQQEKAGLQVFQGTKVKFDD